MVTAHDGGPLLAPVSNALPSTRDLARASVRSRDSAGPSAANSPDPEARLAAYRTAATQLDGAPLFAFLQRSVELERYVFDAAEASAIKAKLAALQSPPKVPSGDEEAAMRERLFAREADLVSTELLLDQPQRAQAFLESLPKRPFTASEQATIETAQAAQRRLHELLELQAEAVDRRAADVDALAWLREERARAADEQRRIDALSVRGSGYARLAFAGGAAWTQGSWAPVATLRSAAFSEELGDHRHHGLDPASALSVLTADATFVGGAGLPRLLRSEFLAASYRNLRREPAPLRTDPLDHLGFGFRGGYGQREGRLFAQRAFLAGEALLVLDETADWSRFAAVGVGAHTALGLDGLRADLLVGPELSVVHRRHLFGGYANALKLSAEVTPTYLVLSRTWTYEVRAKAQVDLQLNAGRLPILLSLQTALDSVSGAPPLVSTTLQIEPLRL